MQEGTLRHTQDTEIPPPGRNRLAFSQRVTYLRGPDPGYRSASEMGEALACA